VEERNRRINKHHMGAGYGVAVTSNYYGMAEVMRSTSSILAGINKRNKRR